LSLSRDTFWKNPKEFTSMYPRDACWAYRSHESLFKLLDLIQPVERQFCFSSPSRLSSNKNCSSNPADEDRIVTTWKPLSPSVTLKYMAKCSTILLFCASYSQEFEYGFITFISLLLKASYHSFMNSPFTCSTSESMLLIQ